MILCKHRQDICRVEAVEVVDEQRRFAYPLTVEFAPHRLCPAGVGYRQMKPVGVDVVPVFRRVEVTEGVSVAVGGYLRVAGGARGEEHQHSVVAAGGVGGSVEMRAEERRFLVEAAPALALAVNDYLVYDLRAFCGGKLRLMRRVAL